MASAAARRGVRRSLTSLSRSAIRSFEKSSSQSSGSYASRLQTCCESTIGTCKGAFAAPRPSAQNFSSSFTASRSAGSPIGGRRFASQIVRLPGEIGVLQSLLPLYSATANSRLVSRLGTNGDAPILQDDEDGT